MEGHDPQLLAIWRQTKIPIVFRRTIEPKLLVRFPYAEDNFWQLRGDKQRKPVWNKWYKAWEVPLAWFNDIITFALRKFSQVYVIQTYREMEKCAPACWNARGYDCECSCMGKNHGSQQPDDSWHEVSETFAYSWGPRRYACRLLKSGS